MHKSLTILIGAAFVTGAGTGRFLRRSRLDDNTAGTYFLIVGSGAPAATIVRVAQAQRRLIAQHSACARNIDCVADAYADPMIFLRNERSNLGL